jgi:hypothetical protein
MRQIELKDTEIDKQRAMIEHLKSKNTELLIKLGLHQEFPAGEGEGEGEGEGDDVASAYEISSSPIMSSVVDLNTLKAAEASNGKEYRSVMMAHRPGVRTSLTKEEATSILYSAGKEEMP